MTTRVKPPARLLIMNECQEEAVRLTLERAAGLINRVPTLSLPDDATAESVDILYEAIAEVYNAVATIFIAVRSEGP